MKILIVITKSEIGGAQVFALNLARGLKASGEEVTVAGGPGEYLPAELEKAGITFYRFQNLKRGFNPWRNLAFVRELKAYAAAGGYDVVHLNSTNALLGAWGLEKLAKKDGAKPKIVFTVHGLSLIDGRHKAAAPLKKAFRLFFRSAFKKLDGIVFVSRLNLESARSSGLIGSGDEKKVSVVQNGLDFPEGYFLAKEEARKFLAEKAVPFCFHPQSLDQAFLYGSIGRLAYPKNYEFLIEAHKDVLKEVPAARLLIIGEGPERHKYEALIATYGVADSVCLFGSLPEAARYLHAFDLFVLPSVFEGNSLSLIEARQAGVPVLASRVGGNEEVAGPDNCFTLNDAADFVRRAVKIAKDGAEKEYVLGAFGVAEMVEGYMRVYKE